MSVTDKRSEIIANIKAIVNDMPSTNKMGVHGEDELYEQLNQIQLHCYKLRNDIWRTWKEDGLLETYWPPVKKDKK